MTGYWAAADSTDISVTWTLGQGGSDPAYDVSVLFCAQEIATFSLDGSLSGQSNPFSVSSEGGGQPAVYGNVQVQALPGLLNQSLSLTIELSRDPAVPGAPQTLATCTYPALPDVKQPVPGSVPVRAPQDTSVAPYCYSGQLRMEFTKDKVSKNYIGTATVFSASDNTGLYLLTCAHNLYDPLDGHATRITFVPGLNGQAPQPAELEAESWHYPPEYVGVAISHDADRSLLSEQMLALNTRYDYGVVKLKSKGAKLPAPAPALLAASDADLTGDPHVSLCGLYGWDATQNQMFTVTGDIVAKTATELRYNASTKPGASGTGIAWVKAGASGVQLIGVHDGSGPGPQSPPQPLYNAGHRIDADSLQNIRKWLTE